MWWYSHFKVWWLFFGPLFSLCGFSSSTFGSLFNRNNCLVKFFFFTARILDFVPSSSSSVKKLTKLVFKFTFLYYWKTRFRLFRFHFHFLPLFSGMGFTVENPQSVSSGFYVSARLLEKWAFCGTFTYFELEQFLFVSKSCVFQFEEKVWQF